MYRRNVTGHTKGMEFWNHVKDIRHADCHKSKMLDTHVPRNLNPHASQLAPQFNPLPGRNKRLITLMSLYMQAISLSPHRSFCGDSEAQVLLRDENHSRVVINAQHKIDCIA